MAGWPFLITNSSSLTMSTKVMSDSKFCHWCEMGFFKKSNFHVDSCRFFVRVRAVKRKREESKEIRVGLTDHEAAKRCRRRLF